MSRPRQVSSPADTADTGTGTASHSVLACVCLCAVTPHVLTAESWMDSKKLPPGGGIQSAARVPAGLSVCVCVSQPASQPSAAAHLGGACWGAAGRRGRGSRVCGGSRTRVHPGTPQQPVGWCVCGGGRVLEDERQEVWGVTTAATAETQQPYAPVYSNEEPACLLPCS